MSQIGRSLEVPAPAALDKFDTAALIMLGELAKRDFDLALTDMLRQLVDGKRLRGCEQGCLDRSYQLVH
jgi:hypothetical protein